MNRPSDVGARVWRIVDGGLWIAAVAGSVALALAVHLGGLQVTRVLSPSMVPAFSPGDLLVIRAVPAASLAVGDIPVLPDPDEPQFQVAHRVVTVRPTPERGEVFVVTRGDANPEADTPATIVSEQVPAVMFSVPLGRLDLARVTWGWSLGLLVGAVAVFLALFLLPSGRRTAKARSAPDYPVRHGGR